MSQLKFRLRLITLLGVVLFIAAPTRSTQASDEAAVRDTLVKSTSTHDISEATKLWVNDDSLVVFEDGQAYNGWLDYRDHHLIPEMEKARITWTLTDMKIHVTGNTAWATFKLAFSADVTMNGQTAQFHGDRLGTAILEKRDGSWRIAHWHRGQWMRGNG